MSATVTDDSFLVKGLRLDVATITDPLISKNERWSGEKMILIPSLIHESLDRGEIVHEFAKTRLGRTFGVIALTPSFGRSSDWEKYGAKRVDTNSIRMTTSIYLPKQNNKRSTTWRFCRKSCLTKAFRSKRPRRTSSRLKSYRTRQHTSTLLARTTSQFFLLRLA
jgi:hypothetical protein